MDGRKAYYFRGLGVLMLAGMLSLAGMWRFGPEAVTASSRVGDRDLPIYCVQTQESKAALTFDAAWGNEDTDKILDTLERHGVKATFFLTGGWVDSYPEDVKKIYQAGHDLGNHSQNHKNMSRLTAQECTEELMRVHEKVKALTGYEMFLFRPPYGDYNNQVVNTAKECGYYTIQWDVDSMDWKNYGEQSLLDQVLENPALGNGSIILCHNGAKYTAAVLDRLIEGLEEKGYSLAPVSELIYRENYRMDQEGRQISNEKSD